MEIAMTENEITSEVALELLETLRLCEGNISSLNDGHPQIYRHWLAVVHADIEKATRGSQ